MVSFLLFQRHDNLNECPRWSYAGLTAWNAFIFIAGESGVILRKNP